MQNIHSVCWPLDDLQIPLAIANLVLTSSGCLLETRVPVALRYQQGLVANTPAWQPSITAGVTQR